MTLPRGSALRLFLTCWLIYALHFATNIVREIYLGISLGDHGTFRVDEFAGLHPDLFEKPGYGWHIDNNPGASILGAVPYALNRWWIDRVVARAVSARHQSDHPPAYDSPWPMARAFYANAWRRGFDLKFGLAAMVMQIFCMAPISALSVLLMFRVLTIVLASERAGLWMSIVYAFGTPIFFRTGTLNQNLLTAHAIFAGFILLWNPQNFIPWSANKRILLSGFAGGLCVLLDTSGAVLLIVLAVYALFKKRGRSLLLYAIGTLPPLLILGFYQWKSFGSPFLPAQYYMPVINPYVQHGFHGYAGIQPQLLWALLFDYRYGLLLSCPVLLLSFAVFLKDRRNIAALELGFLFLFFLAMWIFFSGVSYTYLQFNTGIRYLVAIIPFLWIPTAIVLTQLPKYLSIALSVVAIVQSWCLAMYRDVELGAGIGEPIIRIFTEGPKLPAITTLSRMESFRNMRYELVVITTLGVATAIVWFIWKIKTLRRRDSAAAF
jgi:hypothetical protein